jgi:hypothetical protein
MPRKEQDMRQPDMAELLAASAPGADRETRDRLTQRLKSCEPEDEDVAGIKQFLEDHGYDFDKLHAFLTQFRYVPLTSPAGVRKQIRRLYRTVAVSMAAAAAILWWMKGPDRPKAMERHLFYEPGPPVFASMHGRKEFHELVSAFRLGDSRRGFPYLYRLLSEAPGNDSLMYFGGWLHYMSRHYDSAGQYFSSVAAVPTSVYSEKATLMEAASFCLAYRRDSSHAVLDRILANPRHPYRMQAAAMRRDESLW